MKTSKTFWRIQALFLIVATFVWFNWAGEVTQKLNAEKSAATHASSAEYVAAGNSKNSNNSLYLRYWKILKQRAKKHKV